MTKVKVPARSTRRDIALIACSCLCEYCGRAIDAVCRLCRGVGDSKVGSEQISGARTTIMCLH